jgi:hypothetical protein
MPGVEALFRRLALAADKDILEQIFEESKGRCGVV